MCVNIRSLHKNAFHLSLTAGDGDVLFVILRLFSLPDAISVLMVPGFGSPMQLLRGEVDQFRMLAVYVCDGISAYNYE